MDSTLKSLPAVQVDFVQFVGMIVSEDAKDRTLNLSRGAWTVTPPPPDLKVQKEIKSHIVGFREAFNLFDVSGDGTVALEEFVDTWKSFGFQVAQNTAACTMHPGT